jgi:hypothetical protein
VAEALQFRNLIETLNRHAVDYVIVGAVGAVLQGAPISTLDLDVVYSLDADNLARVVAALGELDAVYRAQPERRLKPQTTHLAAGGHNLLILITRFGPLDVLGSIGNGRSYRDLVPHSAVMDLGGGLAARVLDLETLISVKEEVGGEKDHAMLPVLRRTLTESRRR